MKRLSSVLAVPAALAVLAAACGSGRHGSVVAPSPLYIAVAVDNANGDPAETLQRVGELTDLVDERTGEIVMAVDGGPLIRYAVDEKPAPPASRGDDFSDYGPNRAYEETRTAWEDAAEARKTAFLDELAQRMSRTSVSDVYDLMAKVALFVEEAKSVGADRQQIWAIVESDAMQGHEMCRDAFGKPNVPRGTVITDSRGLSMYCGEDAEWHFVDSAQVAGVELKPTPGGLISDPAVVAIARAASVVVVRADNALGIFGEFPAVRFESIAAAVRYMERQLKGGPS